MNCGWEIEACLGCVGGWEDRREKESQGGWIGRIGWKCEEEGG